MGFRWRVCFDTGSSDSDCAIDGVSVMGFFEWAVLFLLSEVNNSSEKQSYIPQFEMVLGVLWFVAGAMTIFTGLVGLYEWSEPFL
jgi:hypothetical protein